jgi:glycosyltransferase involved in cell wall biosynthesis
MGGGPPFLSVVVPAYNEAARIGSTITSIRTALEARLFSWELLVVDDGSTDDTAAAASAAAADDERVMIVKAAHGGKGAAVRRGMRQASGGWRLLSDADLSTPIDEVDRLLHVAETSGVDIVVASRQGTGANRIGEPGYRHFIGRVFNIVVKAAALSSIEDTQCGFKLFRGAVAEELFGTQRLDGFGFDVEVLYLATRSGFSIREVPVTWTYNGSSKVTFTSGISGFVDILRVRWNDITGVYRDLNQGRFE